MGLRDKVALVLLAVVVTQLTIAHCMPSLSRKASLQRYLNNFKQTRSNPVPKSPLPTRGIKPLPTRNNKPTKSISAKCKNGNIGNTAPPKPSMYKDFNFPEIEYGYDSVSKDPFNMGTKRNGNIFEKINNGVANQQSEAIQKFKKEMRIKRKMNRINDENFHTKRDVPMVSNPSSPKSVWLQDQETFPEVQYPLSAVETWTPNYWNPSLFTQTDDQNHILTTVNPNASDKRTIFYKPYKQQMKSKSKQFLDEIEKFKQNIRKSPPHSNSNTDTTSGGDPNANSYPLAGIENKETQAITTDVQKDKEKENIYSVNTGIPTKLTPELPFSEVPAKNEMFQQPLESDTNSITPTTKLIESATSQIEPENLLETPASIPCKVFEENSLRPAAYELNYIKNGEMSRYEEIVNPAYPITLKYTDTSNASPLIDTDQFNTVNEINLPELCSIPADNVNTRADNSPRQSTKTEPEFPLRNIPLKDEELQLPSLSDTTTSTTKVMEPITSQIESNDLSETPAPIPHKEFEHNDVCPAYELNNTKYEKNNRYEEIVDPAIPITLECTDKSYKSPPINTDQFDTVNEINLPELCSISADYINTYYADDSHLQSTETEPELPLSEIPLKDEVLQLPPQSDTITPTKKVMEPATSQIESNDLLKAPVPIPYKMVEQNDVCPSYEHNNTKNEEIVVPAIPITMECTDKSNTSPLVDTNQFNTVDEINLPVLYSIPADNVNTYYADNSQLQSTETEPQLLLSEIPFKAEVLQLPPQSVTATPTQKVTEPATTQIESDNLPEIPVPIPYKVFEQNDVCLAYEHNNTKNEEIVDPAISITLGCTDKSNTSPSINTDQFNTVNEINLPELMTADNAYEYSYHDQLKSTETVPALPLSEIPSPDEMLLPSAPSSNVHGMDSVDTSSLPDQKDPAATSIPCGSNVKIQFPLTSTTEDIPLEGEPNNEDKQSGSVKIPYASVIVIPVGNSFRKIQIPIIETSTSTPIVVFVQGTQSCDQPTMSSADIPRTTSSASEEIMNVPTYTVPKMVPTYEVSHTETTFSEIQRKPIEYMFEVPPTDISCSKSVLPDFETLPKNSMCHVSMGSMSSSTNKTYENSTLTNVPFIEEQIPITSSPDSFLSDIPNLENTLIDAPDSQSTDPSNYFYQSNDDLRLYQPQDAEIQNMKALPVSETMPYTADMLKDDLFISTNSTHSDAYANNAANEAIENFEAPVKKLIDNAMPELPDVDFIEDIVTSPDRIDIRDSSVSDIDKDNFPVLVDKVPLKNIHSDVNKDGIVGVEKEDTDIREHFVPDTDKDGCPMIDDEVLPNNILVDVNKDGTLLPMDKLQDTSVADDVRDPKITEDKVVPENFSSDIIRNNKVTPDNQLLTEDISLSESTYNLDTPLSDVPKDILPFPMDNTLLNNQITHITEDLSILPPIDSLLQEIPVTDMSKHGLPLPVEQQAASTFPEVNKNEPSLTKGEKISNVDNTNDKLSILHDTDLVDSAVSKITTNDLKLPATGLLLADDDEIVDLSKDIQMEPKAMEPRDTTSSKSSISPLFTRNEILPNTPTVEITKIIPAAVHKGIPDKLYYNIHEDDIQKIVDALRDTILTHIIKIDKSLPVDQSLANYSSTELIQEKTLLQLIEDRDITEVEKNIKNTSSNDITKEDSHALFGINNIEQETSFDEMAKNNEQLLSVRTVPYTLLSQIKDNNKLVPGTIKDGKAFSADIKPPETSSTNEKRRIANELSDMVKNHDKPLFMDIKILETTLADNTENPELDTVADTSPTNTINNDKTLPTNRKSPDSSLTGNSELYKGLPNTIVADVVKDKKILPVEMGIPESLLTFHTRDSRLDKRTPITIAISDIFRLKKFLPIDIELPETPPTDETMVFLLDMALPDSPLTRFNKSDSKLPTDVELLQTSTIENTEGYAINEEAPDTAITDINDNKGRLPIVMKVSETLPNSETMTIDTTQGYYSLNTEPLVTTITDAVKHKKRLPNAMELPEAPLTDKTIALILDTERSISALRRIQKDDRTLPVDIELLECSTTENSQDYHGNKEAPDAGLTEDIENEERLPISIELSVSPLTRVNKNDRTLSFDVDLIETSTTENKTIKLESLMTKNTEAYDGFVEEAPDTIVNDVIKYKKLLKIAMELLKSPLTDKTMKFGPYNGPSDSPLTRINKNVRTLPVDVKLLETSTTENTKGYDALDKEVLGTKLIDIFKNEGILSMAMEQSETPLTNNNMELRPDTGSSDSPHTQNHMDDVTTPTDVELLETSMTEDTKYYGVNKEAPVITFADVIEKEGILSNAMQLSETPLTDNTTHFTLGKGPSDSSLTRITINDRTSPVDIALIETLTTKNIKGYGLDKKAITDIKNEGSLPIAIELLETPMQLETSITENSKGNGLDKDVLYTTLPDVIGNEGSLPNAMELSKSPMKLEIPTTENTKGYSVNKEALDTKLTDVINSVENLLNAMKLLEVPLPIKTMEFGPDTGLSDSPLTRNNKNDRTFSVDVKLLKTSTTKSTEDYDGIDNAAPDTSVTNSKNEKVSPITIELLETPLTDKPLDSLPCIDLDDEIRVVPVDVKLLESLTDENTKGYGLDKKALDTTLTNIINNEGSLLFAMELPTTLLTDKTIDLSQDKEPLDITSMRIKQNHRSLPVDDELRETSTAESTQGNIGLDKEAPYTVLSVVIQNEGSFPMDVGLAKTPLTGKTIEFGRGNESSDNILGRINKNDETFPVHVELPETSITKNTKDYDGSDKAVLHTTVSDDSEDEKVLLITTELPETPVTDIPIDFIQDKWTLGSTLPVDVELLKSSTNENIKNNDLDKEASDIDDTNINKNDGTSLITVKLLETSLPDESKSFRQDYWLPDIPLTSNNKNDVTSPVDVELLETSTIHNIKGLDKEAPATVITDVMKNKESLPIAMELSETPLLDETMVFTSYKGPPDGSLTCINKYDRTLPIDVELLETSMTESTKGCGLDKYAPDTAVTDVNKSAGSLIIAMELPETMDVTPDNGPSNSSLTCINRNDRTLPVHVELLETFSTENNQDEDGLDQGAPDTVLTDVIKNEESLPMDVELPETWLNNNADDVSPEKALSDSSPSKISKDITPLSINQDLPVPLTDEKQLLIDKTIEVILSPEKKYIRDDLASLIEKLPASLGRDVANTEMTNLVKNIFLSL